MFDVHLIRPVQDKFYESHSTCSLLFSISKHKAILQCEQFDCVLPCADSNTKTREEITNNLQLWLVRCVRCQIVQILLMFSFAFVLVLFYSTLLMEVAFFYSWHQSMIVFLSFLFLSSYFSCVFCHLTTINLTLCVVQRRKFCCLSFVHSSSDDVSSLVSPFSHSSFCSILFYSIR